MHANHPSAAAIRFRGALARFVGNGPRMTITTARFVSAFAIVLLALLAIGGLYVVWSMEFGGGSGRPHRRNHQHRHDHERDADEGDHQSAQPTTSREDEDTSDHHGMKDDDDDEVDNDGAASSTSDPLVLRNVCLTAPRSGSDKWTLRPAKGDEDVEMVPAEHLWYAVDDGCAVGHMPKDVATIASLLYSFRGRRSPSTPTLGLIFLHPCATRGEWDKAEAAGPASPTTPFGRLLAPLFQALAGSEEDSKGAVRIRPVFAADVDRSSSNPRCFAKVTTRSDKYRWFGPIGSLRAVRVGEWYRQRLMQHALITDGNKAGDGQRGAQVRVVIVDRPKTRRWVDGTGLLDGVKAALGGDSSTADRKGKPVGIVTLLRLEESTLQEQLRILAEADVVVAAHGAALALAVLAMRGSGGMTRQRPPAAVVEVYPPSFRYQVFDEGLRCRGVLYRAVDLASPTSGSTGRCGSCGISSTSDRGSPHLGFKLHDKPEKRKFGSLRDLNGRGQCKNCDLDWRGRDDGFTVLAAVVDATRAVLLARAGAASSELTVADVDRRG